MKNLNNFIPESELTELQLVEINGGGWISDKVVEILTWCGDNAHRLQTEYPAGVA